MDCYFAPMEGITGYVYRNAHHRIYHNITQYFTPFIAPNRSHKLTSREMNDILPENNGEIPLVPQLLTNRAEDFIWAAEKIQELGYDEVNLNLGCPSGTVVAKYRGAGFLALAQELDRFLETVSDEMQRREMKFSIKTRIGKDSSGEFENLLAIFNRYPLEKLIIHPRIQADFYKNHPQLQVFQEALVRSRNPVCYNGDIFSVDDFLRIREIFPDLDMVMLGRGLLQNPALAEKIKAFGYEAATEKQRLKKFHDNVLEGYRQAIPGDKNVLFKMKELWHYWGENFADEKRKKKIKKARSMEEYIAVAEQLLVGN